uniref:Uncharacterized protein n=1 Tax=Spongospora subterranea TaxID=70186 RepID=A0A0H5QZP7_9EUKA|eukprot:CRZ07453.1 hypothetical protein [Spongospora subterranea]
MTERQKSRTMKTIEKSKSLKPNIPNLQSNNSGISAASLKRYGNRDPPDGGCLHCGGKHWLQVCTKCTPEERKAAFDKLNLTKANMQFKKLVPTSLVRIGRWVL